MSWKYVKESGQALALEDIGIETTVGAGGIAVDMVVKDIGVDIGVDIGEEMVGMEDTAVGMRENIEVVEIAVAVETPDASMLMPSDFPQ